MQVEVFTGAMKAKRRLSELRFEAKVITSQLQDWIIGGKRGERPPAPLILPAGIEYVTIDARGKDGLIKAFATGMMLGRRAKDDR